MLNQYKNINIKNKIMQKYTSNIVVNLAKIDFICKKMHKFYYLLILI